jgi:hypothetical protein
LGCAGPFENDAALDFVGDLTDEPVEQQREGLRAAMTQVLDTSDYVGCPEMDAADDELRTLAAGVFTRAFQPENNEWYELWAESTGHPTENEAALAPFRTAVNSR